MDWVTDLADIRARHGVTNVYAELGTSFASCVVTHPRHCAAMLGMLVKGMGAEHVLWGTDSVWYGSPQWQIEAFRRIEIPDDMQRRHGFAPLGAGGRPGEARHPRRQRGAALRPRLRDGPRAGDASRTTGSPRHAGEYAAAGGERSNLAYGFVRVRV